jgi:molybdopterin-guanine dinucleotide biosynthesis protein A
MRGDHVLAEHAAKGSDAEGDRLARRLSRRGEDQPAGILDLHERSSRHAHKGRCHTQDVAEDRVLAAVLAGGPGSRLGGEKALAEIAGRPLLSYPVAAARAAGLETVLVAKRGTELPELDVPVVVEPEEPRHPLCGVLAALDRAAGTDVLALAGDMPFLAPALLRWMAALDGAALLRIADRLQPLPGRYAAISRERIAEAIDIGEPMAATLAALRARRVETADLERFGEPSRMLFNVSEPVDLRYAERMLATRG